MKLRKLFIKLKERLARKSDFKKKISDFLIANSNCKPDSPLVLIWELGGYSPILGKNAIFSLALKVRGVEAHCVICDGLPEACIKRGLEQNEKIESWGKRCAGCLAEMKKTADKYGLNYSVTGDYVDQKQKDVFFQLSETIEMNEILKYEYLGVRVGELAWSSTNRYMKGYIVDVTELREEDEVIYRKYFYAALINSYVAKKVIEQIHPVSILTSHGVYVDYAPPVSLGYTLGINAISWASGFADFMHYFTVPKAANKLELRGITQIEWQKRAAQPLSAEENQRLDEFIHNRYFKAKARDISILSTPDDPVFLKQALGIDNDNPIVCLFTHINWDACFDLSTMIFDTANQWVVESINKMAEITDVNWIIRIHPGEKTDGSLLTTDDVIKSKFKSFPEHIKIIWSDSDINSYGIYQLIHAGITIFGTCGVELSLFGKPTIVAGNAHYSGKGFTIDAESRKDYFVILENLRSIEPLSNEQTLLARQYAYSYFIQRQIPINAINKCQGHWGDVDLTRLNELLPGNDPIMDAICNGIVNAKDVILNMDMLTANRINTKDVVVMPDEL